MKISMKTLSVLSVVALLIGASDSFASDITDEQRRVAKMSFEDLYHLEVSDVATYFNENDLQVGSKVTTLEEEDWRRYSARHIQEALNHEAGIMSVPSLDGNTALAFRGYLTETSDRGVAILLDGVPINGFNRASGLLASYQFQLDMFNRIELLSGPGSALHGQDAFHGVVSLKTFEEEPGKTVSGIEGGTRRYGRSFVRTSQALSDDFTVHTAAGFSKRGNQHSPYSYTDPNTSTVEHAERQNAYDAYFGIAKFDYNPETPFRLDGGIYHTSQDTDEAPGVGRLFSGGVSALEDRDISNFTNDFTLGRLTASYETSADILIEVKPFYWTNRTSRLDEETLFGDIRPDIFSEVDFNRWGGDVVFSQRDNPLDLHWVLGYSYNQHEIEKSFSSVQNKGEIVFEIAPNTNDRDREANSGFLQLSKSFLEETVHLIVGGRIDSYSDVGSESSPKASLIYQPTRNSAIKLNYSESFRPPTATDIYGLIEQPPVDISSEILEMTELAFVYFAKDWNAEINVFDSHWHDTIAVGQGGVATNIGDSASKGIEAQIETQMSHNALVKLSGSYVRSENKHLDADYVDFPKWIFNLNAGFDCEETGLQFFMTNRVHLGARNGTPREGFPVPEKIKDYWRTDFNVLYDLGESSELYASVLNVFNRDNVYPSLYRSEGGITDAGTTFTAGFRHTF